MPIWVILEKNSCVAAISSLERMNIFLRFKIIHVSSFSYFICNAILGSKIGGRCDLLWPDSTSSWQVVFFVPDQLIRHTIHCPTCKQIKPTAKPETQLFKDNFLEVQPDTSDLTQRTVTFKVLQDSHVPFRQRKLTVLVLYIRIKNTTALPRLSGPVLKWFIPVLVSL